MTDAVVERFLPDPGIERLADLYTDLDLTPVDADRPAVLLGMVSSADGAATLDGRSGGLGGEADRVAFHRLREVCDAILVGAGTVRTERYGQQRLHDGALARRRARSLPDQAVVVVVTASLDLDPSSRLFTEEGPRPILLVPGGTQLDGHPEITAVADVLVAGEGGRVDLVAGLALLAARGLDVVLCEGGPSLAGQLIADGLVDELFLTIAPTLVGGAGPRIVTAGLPAGPRPLVLIGLRHHAGDLLLRYRLGPSGHV